MVASASRGVVGPKQKRNRVVQTQGGVCRKHRRPSQVPLRQRMLQPWTVGCSSGYTVFRGVDIPLVPHRLAPTHLCPDCGAVKLQFEPQAVCCQGGKIRLHEIDPPAELFQLYTGASVDSENFRHYIRIYNSNYAFTSLGVHLDQQLVQENAWIYTFRAQGQVYHTLKPLCPGECAPSALQLYYYDTEHETQNRTQFSQSMLTEVVSKIDSIMSENPYAQFFRSLSAVPDLHNCSIQIAANPNLDQRVYNQPTVSQVAAMWVDDGAMGNSFERHILVHGKESGCHSINQNFGCYDPMQYPLLFPRGEVGWHPHIARNPPSNVPVIRDHETIDEFIRRQDIGERARSKRHRITCRDYYSYKLQIRPHTKSILLNAGRLLQQFVVDMYIKIETGRLGFLKHNQSKLRADWFQGLVDSVDMGVQRGYDSGKRVILPATFIGGPRDMQKRYLDAMSLVRKFGKPDLFITITCNPNWPEIQEELLPFELAQNRPDLTSRVFRAKVEELKKDLIHRSLFGVVAAYTYVVEFQKRGLPHAHFLIILARGYKLTTVEQVDKLVCAEIPDPGEFVSLHALVTKHMMHGPCGDLNKKNVCMRKKGVCKDAYPKQFEEQTDFGEDSFPVYKRSTGGPTVWVRQHALDNRWVVPYNPFLLAKYDCHLNVEVCSSVKAVKYLYKYMYKGHDRVSFRLDNEAGVTEIDEIREFQQARWISPPEATWRIFGFTLNEMYPSVYSLQVHLPGYHYVSYSDDTNLRDLVQAEPTARSMLTAFFELNQASSLASCLLYQQIPEQFVWDKQGKIWVKRKQRAVIGRLMAVSPGEGERYYLRLLLCHVAGPVSFEDLRTIDGKLCGTFREACLQRGMLEDDKHYSASFEEAAAYGMPSQLRQLFCVILALCSPQNPRSIWAKHKEDMSFDYLQRGFSKHDSEHRTLLELQHMLELMGKNINEFSLVQYQIHVGSSDRAARLIEDERRIPIADEDLGAQQLLNASQRAIFEEVLAAVASKSPLLVFVDGPGGTGKTFLYRAILASVRFQGLIGLATASSGVAAGILPGGRTAHYRFKIPLETQESLQCNVPKQSGLASLLKVASLVIWDEAPMMHRFCVEAVDRLLRDLSGMDIPFGGKVVVLGGDFRQVLPVIPKASREEICAASLVQSYLWPMFTKRKLFTNMRAQTDPAYAEYLLRIGDGKEDVVLPDTIQLPTELLIPFTDEVQSLGALIAAVYPQLHLSGLDPLLYNNRVILTPKNECVDSINEILIQTFPGELHTFFSYDEPLETNQRLFETEFLNTLVPNGIPPHKLTLKINSPIILLRNINSAEGLSNGTRLVCKRFHQNLIEAVISTGQQRGTHVLLPRIPFIPLESHFSPFAFKRTQFPVRLCFAMTINKAQGQTLDFVGLYLREPVFSHGQLYVALSRVKSRSSVKVLLAPMSFDVANNQTKNIVYQDLLTIARG